MKNTIKIGNPSKFYFFLENLAKHSSFQRMDMNILFGEILKEKEFILKDYKEEFLKIWEKWVQENGGANVVNFFVNKCQELLLRWLTVIFPFRMNDLNINFEGGGSTVDIILDISYFFYDKEMNFIDFLIKEFNIKEITSQVALTRTIAEPILIFSKIWNDISGYDFTMMPEEEKATKKKNGIDFNMRFVLRPSY